MATITACDLCRKEITDKMEAFSFPMLVVDRFKYYQEQRNWTRYNLELCEDCRMKVVDALSGVLKLKIERGTDDEL